MSGSSSQSRAWGEPDRGSAQAATLIIGLGNPLRGDDGVGVKVAQILAEQSLPSHVEVADGGTQGLGLVNWIDGRQRVVLIDAADVGRPAGEFVRFTLDEAHLVGADQHLSVHAAGLRDALLLAQALKILPDELIIFGVQPANLEWDSTLSPDVVSALPGLVNAVLAEVGLDGQSITPDYKRDKGDDKHGENPDD